MGRPGGTEQSVTRVCEEHTDPFAVLGLHAGTVGEQPVVDMRAFLPGAKLVLSLPPLAVLMLKQQGSRL